MTESASSVINSITRMSYGIVRNMLYNPHIHRNQDIFRNDVDGQIYARNQVHWMVKKVCYGIVSLKILTPLTPMPKLVNLDRLKNYNQLELPLVHRVPVGKPIHPWKHTIVMGSCSADKSPTFLGHSRTPADEHYLCGEYY
jgi:hypothetical protein